MTVRSTLKQNTNLGFVLTNIAVQCAENRQKKIQQKNQKINI